MKSGLILILFISIAIISTTDIHAQTKTSAAQDAENLRVQLSEVQAKETALQIQAQQLDESLKPENIERYFQLNGSTRPEELREQRRKQLSAERAGVLAQLEQLSARRAP